MTAKTAPAPERMVTLDVALLGRDYKVACKESERAELQDAVGFLDRRMREIRSAGKVAGADRIAVMAALNIAHELLRARAQAGAANVEPAKSHAAIDDAAARRRIGDMQSAIDDALAGFERPT
jgi:cell division protein ZapA